MHRDGEYQLINSSGQYLTADTWHHIAVTIDNKTGGSVKFYVDGQLKSEKTLAWPFEGDASEPLNLGAYEPGHSSATYWEGSLDEVNEFSRILTLTEILDIYN